MKTITINKVAEYSSPEIEEIILKENSIICVSDGENEGTGEDDWGDGN